MRFRPLVWIVLSLFACTLVACSGGGVTLPEQAVVVTPPADVLIADRGPDFGLRQVPTAVPPDIITDADAEHLLLTNIYERGAPSVVNIEVITAGPGGFAGTSNGSGFVYDRNGHIITNAHVVDAAESLFVTFDDGFIAEAELIGADVFSDIAVIRVDVTSERLNPLILADSGSVVVGQRAIAIGNPFGLNSSMTVGIVSGLGRNLPSGQLLDPSTIPGFQNPQIIQVDAEINPGNSGGPLLNSAGEVIGVNTAIRTESGTFEGVGFAVPANTVARVVPDLIDDGEVAYSWIGISSNGDLTSYAEALDLPVDEGVLLFTVSPDSPAQEAGLQGGSRQLAIFGEPVCAGGDIIVGINGEAIETMDDLTGYLIVNTRPGDTVNVLVVRGDQTFEVPVTLRARPSTGSVTGFCG